MPIPPRGPASAISTPTITPPASLEVVASPPPTETAALQAGQGTTDNRHIPICPTGPAKATSELETPPPSPGTQEEYKQESLLYPPDEYPCIEAGPLTLYELDASQVARAMTHHANQPLPPPSLVFPWFHGLHPLNHMQQAFFTGRRRSVRKPPSCLRGVVVVKADGDLTLSRLKGAISPDEIMQDGPAAEFVDPDPREGFSVRNFHIQSAKMALVSDIIVYGEDCPHTRRVGWEIAAAQQAWRQRNDIHSEPLQVYNTFVCTSPFEEFEELYGELVAVNSTGASTGHVIDFGQQERREMWDMTRASEISHNVFMGPTPEQGSEEEQQFDVLIECSDMARLNPDALRDVAKCTDEKVTEAFHDFPSSGSILPPTWSQTEADGILATCKWVYHIAHGTFPETEEDHGDSMMIDGEESKHRPRRILIHCADGYTESSMLCIAYYSYSTGQPVPAAWLSLHTEKGRNFFAYPTDVALLKAISPRLLLNSPACKDRCREEVLSMARDEPDWLPGLDGSFPSRILNYLYLGNLGHANNPDLLRELGIGQLLSVGETAAWREGDLEKWGEDNVCMVQGVQDNGIDPLTDEFTRCLDFIERGRQNGTATLVHCRVGVSRSATICIAEVMRTFGMSFPRAYCFVRARRLNVIIQPHLLFAYELLRWEEELRQAEQAEQDEAQDQQQQQQKLQRSTMRRELDWGDITREIALMNRPYAR